MVPQRPDSERALEHARALLARAADDPRLEGALARELAEAELGSLARILEVGAPSRGEVRKLHLLAAKLAAPELLLLDEPTQDLDAAGETWLLRWLARRPGALIVTSHSRRLLRGFEHFFHLAESGCRYLCGGFDEIEARLARDERARQRRYVEHLNTLADAERHNEIVLQRRRRKKNVGRLHELDRCTPRSRLNKKRGAAQVSQGRVARIRDERIGALRGWARATRRALAVELPLDALGATLPEDDRRANITLDCVGVEFEGLCLFGPLDAAIGRQRVALTGPNGSGKTTLIQIMLGQRRPSEGRAHRRSRRIGSIAQGGSDWMLDECLIERLFTTSAAHSLDEVAQLILGHRFPLALAERPLVSLSPGERVRAALICLSHQQPAVELLVLDEPTFSLDFAGLAALTDALAAWPGGLVVASHDREFLDALAIEQTIVLGGEPSPAG